MEKAVSKVRAAKIELYRKHGTIHAKAVDGRFNRLRWAAVWLTQIVFYGACWLQWTPADTPRQAILFDIAHEKLYLFGLVLWPQDALLLAIALLLAALGLFFVTALAGRLFCGFACPQTVYTSIFVWIEARIEGDHLARLKLDQSPLSAGKLGLKIIKHGVWLLIAAWTGITFVGYFTPIRELLPSLAAWQTGPWEAFWLIFYTAFTYVQAGLAREAVCQHMCPYSRFQGVMFDPATRQVGYDHQRGEPRAARRQDKAAGDCIDCAICVEVCPTGIDIRNGLQYQCINCGLCIDACDQVMQRLKLPTGLIRFASENELNLRSTLGPAAVPVLLEIAQKRPRIIIYASLIAAFAGLGAWTLSQRTLLVVDVWRDRGALLREMPDGRIENAYTLKLTNQADTPRRIEISADGLPGLEIVGARQFDIPAGSIQPIQLTLAAPSSANLSGLQAIALEISSPQDGLLVRQSSRFALP
jgi:cytochrome c oxidase accessory protein FixG